LIRLSYIDSLIVAPNSSGCRARVQVMDSQDSFVLIKIVPRASQVVPFQNGSGGTNLQTKVVFILFFSKHIHPSPQVIRRRAADRTVTAFVSSRHFSSDVLFKFQFQPFYTSPEINQSIQQIAVVGALISLVLRNFSELLPCLSRIIIRSHSEAPKKRRRRRRRTGPRQERKTEEQDGKEKKSRSFPNDT
jgi:hypothetical protein